VRRPLSILAALATLSAVAAAEPPSSRPMPAALAGAPMLFPGTTVDRLDNGLTVVVVPAPSGGTAAFFTLVRAGSRDEVEPGKSGYAHLFEHLMFRGTRQVPAREYEKKMQALGSDNNAFTTTDFTLYVPLVPADSLAELVPIEADRFQNLDVPEAAYKDETGAVLGEYNKDFANPWWLMDEAIRKLAFEKHTYGHTVIGFGDDVRAMPKAYEYSRQFFKRFYTPDNCTIFVVGDVRRADVMALVKKHYTGWQGKRAETRVTPEPEQKAARRKDLVWKGPTVPRLQIGWKVPAVSASMNDAAALSVLVALVFGEPGELYQRLVVREQKVLELSADPDDALNLDPGLLLAGAKLKAGTSFEEILSAVQGAVDDVGAGKAKEDDVVAAREHLLSSITLGMQTPTDIAIRMAYLTAKTGDPRALDQYVDAIRRVTPADVARVAAAYLTTARRNVVTLSPPGPAAPKPKEAPKKDAPKKEGKS
jgi:zinc protease